ncbi:MAG: hypothetical protein ABSD85_17685 [Acidimicrobiales bacterium]
MLFAMLDEAMPADHQGIYYVVAAAVVIGDQEEARQAASAVIANPRRTLPFHWYREGTRARDGITECLVTMGAVAHVCVHYPTGRHKQAAARERGLEVVVPRLVHDGVDELLIESRRDFNDERDERVISRVLDGIGRPDALACGWHTKAEPLLWFADALCGIVSDYLLRGSSPHYERLCANSVISEPVYTNESVSTHA